MVERGEFIRLAHETFYGRYWNIHLFLHNHRYAREISPWTWRTEYENRPNAESVLHGANDGTLAFNTYRLVRRIQPGGLLFFHASIETALSIYDDAGDEIGYVQVDDEKY